MINLDPVNAVLLVPIGEIKKAFVSDLRQRVWDLEKECKKSKSLRQKNIMAVEFFQENSSDVCSSITVETLQRLVEACCSHNPNDPVPDKREPVEVFFELSGKALSSRKVNQKNASAFSKVARLVLISLWSQGMIILPKGFTSVKLPSERVNEIARNTPCNFMYKILALNPASSLDFNGAIDEKLRVIVCNHWLRLIYNTNWTSSDNVTGEDIRLLIESGSGSRHSLLARYYVTDFLFFLFSDYPDILNIYEKIQAEIKVRRDEESIDRALETQKRRKEFDKERNRNRKNKKYYKSSTDVKTEAVISYYNGESDLEFEDLVGDSITNYSVRKIFFRDELDVECHPLYSVLDNKVKEFVLIIDRTFKSFIDSKRIEKPDQYEFGLALLLCYVSIYLPRFFNVNEGGLESYPNSFNKFVCAYFVARNENLADLMDKDEERPITYFQFIEMFGEKYDWDWNETTYSHLKNAERYFLYIQSSSAVIPSSDKFQCSISDSDIPKTRRRSTTVKNILPREYFRTFLSLLETLEYLVDHLNGMADGVNPGILNGRLVIPTYNQLITQSCWRSIWGAGGTLPSQLDTECLNYTPVIHYESKYYPLKEILRFYTRTPYKVNGVLETRVSPLVPRILWLIANTGIRQKHLLWLDKDGFDAAISSRPTGLAPLIVSTDKAHAEWVSIVSKDVIEVCQRQREWLENNEIETLKEPMWYSETEKSRFGKFVPLFRLDASHKSWEVHSDVGKVMWMLEKFIRHQLGDKECLELAYWRPSNTSRTPGKLSDHKMNIEEFKHKEVDLSWDWKLYSIYTAHGLRAAFVSDRMRFLPPSLVGRHLTGQFSDSLVWYYTIIDAEDIGDHQQLLINLLMRNEEQIKGGGAPELAQKIMSMNQMIAKDIELDPEGAVSTHGLFSLSDIDDSKNGIAELKAKKYTRLAFNPTHICPFDNSCPVEVVKKFGLGKPCVLCPYAIRGVMHLPALNAEKFKYVELMEEYGEKIKVYKKRPKNGVIRSELEGLEAEYDRLTRDAYAIEAIEQQLYHMRDANDNPYIAQDSQTIKDLYETLELDESEHLIKRLIDVQTFGDLDSPKIQRKFALLRYKLLMAKGDLAGLLEERDEPENALLASQLHSLMAGNELSIRDLYKIASSDIKSRMDSKPVLNKLGFDGFNLTNKEGSAK